jgi:hypothetical protein
MFRVLEPGGCFTGVTFPMEQSGGDGNHVFVVGGGERQFVIFPKK